LTISIHRELLKSASAHRERPLAGAFIARSALLLVADFDNFLQLIAAKRKSSPAGLRGGSLVLQLKFAPHILFQIKRVPVMPAREPQNFFWSRRADLNRWPADYESAALPTELRRPVCFSKYWSSGAKSRTNFI
jgi:hypothetical protein